MGGRSLTANNGSCLLNAQIQLNDVVGIFTFFKVKSDL